MNQLDKLCGIRNDLEADRIKFIDESVKYSLEGFTNYNCLADFEQKVMYFLKGEVYASKLISWAVRNSVEKLFSKAESAKKVGYDKYIGVYEDEAIHIAVRYGLNKSDIEKRFSKILEEEK